MIDECIARYKKLLRLIDEDSQEMERCVQGEILDAYRRLLEQEKENLQSALRALQKLNL